MAGLLALTLSLGCRQSEVQPPVAATPVATVPRPARVTGEVRLAGEGDASGIQVYIPGTSLVSITGRDGRFTLDGVVTGAYEIFARADGYRIASVGKITVVPSDKDQQFRLAPVTLERAVRAAPMPPADALKPGSIRGRVMSPAEPTTDWSLCALELERTTFRTVAAPDGTFLFWNLPPDQYQVIARMPGFDDASASVRVLPGPVPTTVSLTLTPVTPGVGGFVYVSPAGTPPTVSVTAASTPVSTATTARLHGVVLKNQEGLDDMSGIGVTLAGTSLMATTNAEGGYVIENVTPGTHQVIAQAEGFEPAQQQIEIAAGDDLELEEMLLEPQLEYPVVLESNPADGARGVIVQRAMPLYVRFSKKMNPDSLRKAVRFEPPVAFTIVTGREQSDTDFDLMKIVVFGALQQPAARFRTRYSLIISEAATDFEGLTLQEPFRMSFTTGDAAVIGTSPANGAREVGMSPQIPVVISFNASMNYATLNASVIRIQPEPELRPSVSLYDDQDTGWTRLSVTGMWRPDTEYRVTVLRRARTLTNDPISNAPYTFRFRTAKLVLIRPPTTAPRSTR